MSPRASRGDADLAAMLFATGIDPERSTVFVQSHVSSPRRGSVAAERSHELRRVAADDAVQGQGRGAGVRLGRLFTYPVLMAGDILLYQTDIVPIGDDQRQHLELAVTSRSASTAATARPSRCLEGVFPEVGARIMDLQEPERKMSTSGRTPIRGRCGSLDEPDVDPQEVQDAVTDSGREVRHDAGQARRLEPHRDHDRRHRRVDRGGRGAATTARATARSRKTSARRSSHSSRPSRSATTSYGPTRPSYGACSRSEPTRRAWRRRRHSTPCTTAWASSARRDSHRTPQRTV